MKVVHILTYDVGGAANAVIRLHNGLLDSGINSSILTSVKTRDDVINLYECESSYKKATILQKILNRIGLPQTIEQRNWWVPKKLMIKDYIKFGKNTGTTLFFSLNSSYRVEDHPLVKDADIIHLHWVSGFINFASFFKKIKKPIVWTLHDKGVILGGFHLLLDYDKSSSVWKKKSEFYQRKKSEYVLCNNNISIVSPSKSLLDFSKQSYLSRYPHYQIVYGIDTDQFSDIRVERGNKTTFLVVADGFFPHKGFDILLDALTLVKRDDFELIVVGSINKKLIETKVNYRFLGKISNISKLVELYNKADAVLIPSREDNLPNVMLESLSCGTPVIATPVGGMLDIIENGVNGILSADLSSQSFANVIIRFLETKNNFDRTSIRKNAVSLFSLERQADSYLKLYRNLQN